MCCKTSMTYNSLQPHTIIISLGSIPYYIIPKMSTHLTRNSGASNIIILLFSFERNRI